MIRPYAGRSRRQSWLPARLRLGGALPGRVNLAGRRPRWGRPSGCWSRRSGPPGLRPGSSRPSRGHSSRSAGPPGKPIASCACRSVRRARVPRPEPAITGGSGRTATRSRQRDSRPDRVLFRPVGSRAACGCSSVGRARPSQGRCREFESRHPLCIDGRAELGCPARLSASRLSLLRSVVPPSLRRSKTRWPRRTRWLRPRARRPLVEEGRPPSRNLAALAGRRRSSGRAARLPQPANGPRRPQPAKGRDLPQPATARRLDRCTPGEDSVTGVIPVKL